MGLREEKQARQRALIIENAIALFRERGFGAVRIREIAEACAISDATFFNYFGTKDALLREWAELELDTSLVLGTRRAGAGGLRRVVGQWAAEWARRIGGEPELMAEAWSRMRIGDLGVGRDSARGRLSRTDSLEALIAEAQRVGNIRSDLEPRLLAQLIRNCLAGSISSWLAEPEGETAQTLQNRLVQGAGVLLDGFRKRNERVPAPRASQKPNSSPSDS
jgi:AcrR family transcriptional regulator